MRESYYKGAKYQVVRIEDGYEVEEFYFDDIAEARAFIKNCKDFEKEEGLKGFRYKLYELED